MDGGSVAAALGAGFALGHGFIFSIGPQNLRLIHAGSVGRHGGAVATAGYLSEIAIATAGVAGLGVALASAPDATAALQAVGVVFLAAFGLRALARRGSAATLAAVPTEYSRGHALMGMLAVTWLNPLVYVEVMLLVGVLSNGYGDTARLAFVTGFLTASAVKFYGWTWVGARAARLLSEPRGRVAFDRVSGALLLAAAGLLALHLAG